MVTINPAIAADLPRLVELECRTFASERISRRQFRYLLTKANSIFVKVEQGSRLLAYMVLLKRRNSSRLRIYSVAVAESARKHGIARSLIGYAEELAADHDMTLLSLEVCEHNLPAVQLYRDAGFFLAGQRVGYYEDGCTAILLRKKIFPPVIHP